LSDRPVFTFTGDSGFWFHIGEIETAVRWKINAVTLVNNHRFRSLPQSSNAAGVSFYRGRIARGVASDLPTCDFRV